MKKEIAEKKLKKLLINEFYHTYEDCGVWSFGFSSKVWLIAQEIAFEDEDKINDALKTTGLKLLNPDSVELAKSVLVARNKGYEVTNVSIIKNSELLIEFETGFNMIVKTDTDIVDWHWSLSEENTSPYHTKCIEACIHPSDYE
ncbi:MAG TPA: hypothetical protein PLX38_11895 [Gammaproteobacteria bacterium]|nr:hypothetical protein [Xanthomonadales bacterium]HPI96912.1 hypothetical protein [Gammaproteobacteria bacterium]